MATYTSTNGVKLISTGDEAGTWGDSTNVNLQILDRAANGFASIALTGTSYTLPVAAQPSAAQDGHYKAIKFTGTPGGACTVTLEQNDRARMYMLVNSTNQTVIVTQGSGSNVTIAAGDSATVLADGAGSGAAVEEFSNSSSMSVATIAVTVSDPGSGNKYYIDGSLQQTVELKPSVTYRFDQSDSSNGAGGGHPLAFSTNDNNSPSAPFTTGVTTVGTPGSAGAYTQIKLEQDAPAVLYYYCTNHSGMGGKAVVRVTDLTADRVLVADSGGDLSVSAVTTTKLGYLDDVTSAIQAQIDAKSPIASPTFTGTVTIPGFTVSGGTQNWSTTASGTDLTFAYNGVSKASISANNSVSGVIGEQASSVWTTGTGTTESLISPAKLKAAADSATESKLNISGTAPIYGVRAWVNFVGTGSSSANATLNGSGNIATVYKTSNGIYTATFTTALPDANYAITFAAGETTSASANDGTCIDVYSRSASAFSFTVTDPSGNNYASPHTVMITVVR